MWQIVSSSPPLLLATVERIDVRSLDRNFSPILERKPAARLHECERSSSFLPATAMEATRYSVPPFRQSRGNEEKKNCKHDIYHNRDRRRHHHLSWRGWSLGLSSLAGLYYSKFGEKADR